MSVVGTAPPPRGPYTVRDLDAMPDDGRRHEILDGVLLVTPSPAWRHQFMVTAIWRLLDDARPPDVLALVAPYDVHFSENTVLEPDVLVARLHELPPGPGRFRATPLLVVEILSPGTRSRDQVRKRAAYQRHGVPAYWIVDPDRDRPAVTVLELRDGRYVEVADLRGDDKKEVTIPFPVTLCPIDLVADQ